MLRQGRLAPYTYFYDHAPAGWILLAAWMGLTGGPFTFGGAIDSGPGADAAPARGHGALAVPRGAQAGLSAAGARRWPPSCSPSPPWPSTTSACVLLDNIMLFWLLLSLDLLLDGWGRLSRLVLERGLLRAGRAEQGDGRLLRCRPCCSSPGSSAGATRGASPSPAGCSPMAVVVSLYPLYAALKGELLPAGAVARLLHLQRRSAAGPRLAGRGPTAGRPRAPVAGCSTWTTSSGS